MKTAITAFALVIGLSVTAIAKPKQPAASQTQRTRAAARVIKASNIKPSISKPAAVLATPVDGLLVTVVDTSPSVGRYWKEMQQAAKQIIAGAPEQSSSAVVGIDAEAVKSDVFDPARKADAIKFVDGLTIGGRFTDLARGTDAALSVLQGANPNRCVLVYLTDGKLTVPNTFREKGTFYDLLRREFSPRNNVTVLIVNVRGDNAMMNESLPPNVKIFPLKSASELPDIVRQTLSPAINEKLTATTSPASQSPLQISGSNNRAYWIAGVAVISFLGLSFLVLRKRLRRRKSDGLDDGPENLLRQEDLEPQESASEPVALLTAEAFEAKSGHRLLPRRALIRTGEHVTVGGSKFVEMSLDGLKQAQTLRVGFDGRVVHVDRLRPVNIGELDAVWLNQQAAPIQFVLTERDALSTGNFSIKLTITTDESVPSSLVSQPAMVSGKNSLSSRRFAG